MPRQILNVADGQPRQAGMHAAVDARPRLEERLTLRIASYNAPVSMWTFSHRSRSVGSYPSLSMNAGF